MSIENTLKKKQLLIVLSHKCSELSAANMVQMVKESGKTNLASILFKLLVGSRYYVKGLSGYMLVRKKIMTPKGHFYAARVQEPIFSYLAQEKP